MNPAGSYDVHVVSHTHWDREWYLPLARFRQRLVALVDELLASPPRDSGFLLDGQAVLLDDYLAVRPERENDLRALLARGVLEAGPWYVLADELLPSGEALVRNLLAGQRAVRARGGAPLSILYCPDSFGHPADLPTLAAGFGFPLTILWRGLGGEEWPDGDAFRWRAPGGAAVLVHHLPPYGYEYGANLPTDDSATRARWDSLRRMLSDRARTRVLLVLNGADHHARQSGHDDAIATLSRVAAPDRIHSSTLSEFATAFVEQASKLAGVPEIEGELRFSPGYTWTVPGTWSSRSYQKRRNARIERIFTREAEPWAAIAAARGGPGRGSLLRAAWRTLLECHPHDTLCGCSTDAVAMAADARFAFAKVEARGIVTDSILDLMGHDADAARASRAWLPQILLRNASAVPRGGVAEVEVARFVAHEPVGPGSGSIPVNEAVLAPPALDVGRVPLQVLGRRIKSDRIDSARHYPDNDRVEVTRGVAWVDEIPGYGIRPLSIGDASPANVQLPVDAVCGTRRSLDNGIIRLELDDEGTLRLTSKRLDRSWMPLVRFEDVGDAGDLYTHSPIEPTIRTARVTATRLIHAGPIRAELRVSFALDVPVSSSREGRVEERVRNSVHLTLALDAGSSFLRIGLRGVNRARDHRLRIVLATGIPEGVTRADAMFGPVTREPHVQPSHTRTMELIPDTAPLARWVSRTGTSHGMTVISDGLGEYEVIDDGSIAVTLVRAVGALSRRDLPERPGHAGWPVSTPGAQTLGPFRAQFAVLPHGASPNVVSEIERATDDVLLPLRGTTLRSAVRPLERVAGLSLRGDGLRFLACKPSEEGEWTVLRCVNVTTESVTGSWHCGWPLREARQARLDEQMGDDAPIRDGSQVAVTVAPRAVATILVR